VFQACFKFLLVDLDPFVFDEREPNPAEAEFLDEIQTKVLRDFLLDNHSHLYTQSKNSKDAQKPRRNCTFMNSASGLYFLQLAPFLGDGQGEPWLHQD
jgi:hypothetical protein